MASSTRWGSDTAFPRNDEQKTNRSSHNVQYTGTHNLNEFQGLVLAFDAAGNANETTYHPSGEWSETPHLRRIVHGLSEQDALQEPELSLRQQYAERCVGLTDYDLHSWPRTETGPEQPSRYVQDSTVPLESRSYAPTNTEPQVTVDTFNADIDDLMINDDLTTPHSTVPVSKTMEEPGAPEFPTLAGVYDRPLRENRFSGVADELSQNSAADGTV